MQDVVLLGASNLVLSWPTVMSSLRRLTAAPLRVNVAMGMGRSYIKSSAFWFRRLPSIQECQLWNLLPQSAVPVPPVVLITDLGNDIVYLFEPEEIADSLRECIRKVQSWRPDAKIVVTGLPLASLMGIGKSRFVVARTVLFPSCTLSQRIAIDRSVELDQRARKIAADSGVNFIEPDAHWYGVDPIHVLAKYRAEAFSKYFAGFGLTGAGSTNHPRQFTERRLPTAAERIIFGRRKTIRQPVISTADCTVSAW